MPRRRAQADPAGLSDARVFLDKAREFLRAAQDSLELSNNTAAVGNAVHAGILAADAISAVRTRTVWEASTPRPPRTSRQPARTASLPPGSCAGCSP